VIQKCVLRLGVSRINPVGIGLKLDNKMERHQFHDVTKELQLIRQ
jgi:hypothetical protein